MHVHRRSVISEARSRRAGARRHVRALRLRRRHVDRPPVRLRLLWGRRRRGPVHDRPQRLAPHARLHGRVLLLGHGHGRRDDHVAGGCGFGDGAPVPELLASLRVHLSADARLRHPLCRRLPRRRLVGGARRGLVRRDLRRDVGERLPRSLRRQLAHLPRLERSRIAGAPRAPALRLPGDRLGRRVPLGRCHLRRNDRQRQERRRRAPRLVPRQRDGGARGHLGAGRRRRPGPDRLLRADRLHAPRRLVRGYARR